MRKTLADVKKSRIHIVLGLGPNDPRLLDYVNEAQDRLMQDGRWWATIQRIQLCVRDGCITWPYGVANAEQVSVCGIPTLMRNGWYEFIPFLGRIQQCDGCASGCSSNAIDGVWRCGHLATYDHGTVSTAVDIRGPQKKIRVYPASATDVGKRILFQGRDDNNIEIRNTYDGVMIPGEYLTLALPYVDSVSYFSAITGVQKDETNDVVRVYEVNSEGDERWLSIYDPGEVNPSYRRSFIPNIKGRNCGKCSGEDSHIKTVTAQVKLDFIPVKRDTDWLVINNIPALKDMCQSIVKEEKNETGEAEALKNKAIRQLNQQLRTMTGNRTEVFVNSQGSAPLNRVLGGFV